MIDESVSERVDFFCALSVFVLERSFFLRIWLLRGFCPPGYWDNFSMSGVF